MIYLAADHGGFALKERAKGWFAALNLAVEDVGAHQLEPHDDYPTFAFAAARQVAKNPEEHKALLVCRSGGGMAIAANRFPGVRAVECTTVEAAKIARAKNDANMLTLPADWVSDDQARAIIEAFFTTPFSSEERHVRRIAQLDDHLSIHPDAVG